jgi:UDP-N-acetylmuramoyl-L-alanyl-D-glutamate--2,6-diaminopimelate ligase
MKNLRDIIYKAGIREVVGNTDTVISGITIDSRSVNSRFLFIAMRGLQTDGHLFITQAVKAGATAIVCETIPDHISSDVTYVRVQDTSDSLSTIASNFYDHPDKKLSIIGVTGTNGKTSIVTLLYKLFWESGIPSGLISTIKNMVGSVETDARFTTPDPIGLNMLLSDMVNAGCEYVFMEVSSHAVVQKRIAGIQFTGGVFTNLTHDHLDYHKNFMAYLQAKKTFFDCLEKEAFALTNIDDKNGLVMLQNTRAVKKTYGLLSMADFHARILESGINGMHLQIGNQDVWCRLIGRYNAYNLLAVFAVTSLLGLDKEKVLTILSSATPPEGRFDHFIGRDHITAIVDYAHTPDALENVLKAIQEIRSGNESLITVVGCGGNRDTAKRPVMASIAATYSDKVLLTSDNPRMEDPEKIIDDMKKGLDPVGVRKSVVIVNRKEAIRAACAMANKHDIILVAGKGHEKYQEIKGVRAPFDDKQILQDMLNPISSY